MAGSFDCLLGPVLTLKRSSELRPCLTSQEGGVQFQALFWAPILALRLVVFCTSICAKIWASFGWAAQRQKVLLARSEARRCKLVVVSVEVGGRFGAEAAAFLRKLAAARARDVPARLRFAARQASLHRWTGMLAIAAQRAFAHSLLELPPASVDASSGTEPPLTELLADARGIRHVPNSHLPALMGPQGQLAGPLTSMRSQKRSSCH